MTSPMIDAPTPNYKRPDTSKVIADQALLTPAEIERYEADGFLVLENFTNSERIAALKAAAQKIIDDFDMDMVSVFSTEDQRKLSSDLYFLESGDKIRCFFETHAFDNNGKLIKDKQLAINKLGHAMHDIDPVFEAFSYVPELCQAAIDLGFVDPIAAQSMYIFKQPSIGDKVNAHQDSTFLNTDLASCTGFWFALEDATQENGCLWAIPGSHKTYPITRHFRRNAAGKVPSLWAKKLPGTYHKQCLWR
ncbi:phytanoyl-CoA dioxygenase family protein [Microscilla marina]|nr:phytanoyl-CoA dioxygenase family protein [Microscilla marina]